MWLSPSLHGLSPPGSAAGGDGSVPTDASIAVRPLPGGASRQDRIVRVSWRYRNSYGNVPQRDDVRFNVAIKEIALPASRRPPLIGDYPDLDETKGQNSASIDGGFASNGTTKLVQNVSYLGHSRFIEPAPSMNLRDFKIDFPAKCNRRYLVRILAKRFCFDQSLTVYGTTDHLLYTDASCD